MPGVARVLVVEDDAAIAEPLTRALGREGYDVAVAGSIAAAAAVLGGSDGGAPVDVVVLDRGLPDGDGLEVVRRAREASSALPFLVLTARAEEVDLVIGLDAGADDYLTKPFRMRELAARVAALLRRVQRAAELAAGPAAAPLVVGGLSVDPAARRVHADGAEVHLTPTEFDLLHALAATPGHVLTRERLLAQVWGWEGGAGATRTVDSHVRSLRAKVGADRVRTAHGVGYALEPR